MTQIIYILFKSWVSPKFPALESKNPLFLTPQGVCREIFRYQEGSSPVILLMASALAPCFTSLAAKLSSSIGSTCVSRDNASHNGTRPSLSRSSRLSLPIRTDTETPINQWGNCRKRMSRKCLNWWTWICI